LSKVQVGRLAFRKEGTMWNAYYALPDTMEDSELLGSLQCAFAGEGCFYRTVFMDMMSEIVADIIEEATGTRPTMPGPTKAPEHERSGHA